MKKVLRKNWDYYTHASFLKFQIFYNYELGKV